MGGGERVGSARPEDERQQRFAAELHAAEKRSQALADQVPAQRALFRSCIPLRAKRLGVLPGRSITGPASNHAQCGKILH